MIEEIIKTTIIILAILFSHELPTIYGILVSWLLVGYKMRRLY